jgi:hypothetical protein
VHSNFASPTQNRNIGGHSKVKVVKFPALEFFPQRHYCKPSYGFLSHQTIFPFEISPEAFPASGFFLHVAAGEFFIRRFPRRHRSAAPGAPALPHFELAPPLAPRFNTLVTFIFAVLCYLDAFSNPEFFR